LLELSVTGPTARRVAARAQTAAGGAALTSFVERRLNNAR
jgi:hypothetical protein